MQKDVGTLDKVEMPIKVFGEIADTAFCIVADNMILTFKFMLLMTDSI